MPSIEKDTFKDALNKIIKQWKIDQTYDIPYIGGVSKDHKTIYIDKDIPNIVDINGKTIDYSLFLAAHEAIEGTIFEMYDLGYNPSHEIARVIEKALMEASGIDWNEVEKYTNELAKILIKKPFEKIPKDLDLTPYEDMKFKGLDEMKEKMES